MPVNLSAIEARIIGCLMEKSVVTPDQYPLTLNSLTNACNQKSSRTPVMHLEPRVVRSTVHELAARHLVNVEENFKSGVEKYRHRLCNTAFSEYQLDAAQFALICLLLLRGPQTPGELRSRSPRLHEFEDNEAVVDALTSLIERDGEPLVVKLPRTPGRRDSEYMHLLCGPVDVETPTTRSPAASPTSQRISVAELARRVADLEQELARLKDVLRVPD